MVALVDLDVAGVLKGSQMPGKVAVGYLEGVAEVAELDPVGLAQDGQHAKPGPLMHDLIEPIDGMAATGGSGDRGRVRVVVVWGRLGHDERRARQAEIPVLAAPNRSTAASKTTLCAGATK